MNYCRNSAHFYPAVPDVKITDGFFAPFIEKIRTVTTPDVFAKFLADGAIENYERVARGEKGAVDYFFVGSIDQAVIQRGSARRGASSVFSIRRAKSSRCAAP